MPASPDDPNTLETQDDLLTALGAITKSNAPDTLKLLQIIDTTSQSIDPQTDSLSQLITIQAQKELDKLASGGGDSYTPIDYINPTGAQNGAI